jgi:HPt (histidine-containing phosphotransfer) domain-containing protein
MSDDQGPIIDDKVINMLRGRAFNRIKDIFFGQYPKSVEEMKGALEAEDMDKLKRAAHYFKGSCFTLGAMRMGDVCAKIQKGAMVLMESGDDLSDEDRSNFNSYFSELDESYNLTTKELDNYKKE